MEEDKASSGAGGGGTLRIVPYVVHRLSFGQLQEDNVPGLYDGPFPWENIFGFHLAGMVGHDFFKPLRGDLRLSKYEDLSAVVSSVN